MCRIPPHIAKPVTKRTNLQQFFCGENSFFCLSVGTKVKCTFFFVGGMCERRVECVCVSTPPQEEEQDASAPVPDVAGRKEN